MSHIVFPLSILSSARLWAFLQRVDEAEAARLHLRPCPHCGAGRLHKADWRRNPAGLAVPLRGEIRRFGLCCGSCRRRVKPASVRFFCRRRRVAPVFLAACLAALARGARLSAVARRLNIPLQTLRRWRDWWREEFPGTGEWRALRAELPPAPDAEPLVRLVGAMRGRSLRSRLLRSLLRLRPGGGGSCTISA